MNVAPPFTHALSPFYGAVLFLGFVLVGAAYIVWAKLAGIPPVEVTGIPLGLMVLYAMGLGLARYFRLRDDQAGDNLYYLGFLYTLTSLGVSLWQFSVNDGADAIVTNFGVAIASTILGVALRVVFNQMRQDPLEVERTARLELADAARRVKQELDATTFEFASFRRATQQIFEEGLVQTREHAQRLEGQLSEAIRDFPGRCSEPLKTASEQSKETIDRLATALAGRLESTGNDLAIQVESLASTAGTVTSSLEAVQSRLRAIQTPDGIIEVKLQPFISGFTKAINNQAKATGEQMGDLKKIISKFDESVGRLVEHMGEVERNRSVEQQLLRELLSQLEAASAETQQLLSEINKKLADNLPRRSERNGLFPGWLRGNA
jgi:hypothetical protein